MRPDILRWLSAGAAASALCMVAIALAGDSEPARKRRYVAALYLNDAATRAAAVTRDAPIRLLGGPEGKQNEVTGASSIFSVRAGGFVADDSAFLLSGFARGGSPMTVLSRVTDGVDLARTQTKEGQPSTSFAELANSLSVPSADGTRICRLSASGEIEVFDARTGRRGSKIRCEPTPDSIVAFPATDSVIVTLSKSEIARVSLSDGKTLWRTRIRRVEPRIQDEELESKNGAVDWVSQIDAVAGSDRVILVASARLPAWRGLLALEWSSGKEVWRRELDAEFVAVARQRRFVVCVNGATGWMTVNEATTGEIAGYVELPRPPISAVAISAGGSDGVAARADGSLVSFTIPASFETETDGR